MGRPTIRCGNAGFSYIEILIAMAILTIIFIPVLTGFRYATRNFNYAANRYAAGLFATNLLMDLEKACIQGKAGTPDMFAGLDDSYNDRFDYLVTVQGLNGTIWKSQSSPNLISSGGAELTMGFPSPTGSTPPAYLGLAVTYDNGFHVRDGAGGQAYIHGSQCRIVIDEGATVRLYLLDCPSTIHIVLENNHETVGYLDVYRSAGFQADHVSFSYIQNPGGTIVRFLDGLPTPGESGSYIFTVEIFDKDGTLINKAANFLYAGTGIQ